MTYVIIGLGETGKPLYELIKESGQDIIGVDMQPIDIKKPVEIMHICLRADDEKWLIDKIIEYDKKYNPEIIVINSTATPGMTREIQEKLKKPVAHSPLRGIHKRMKEDIKFYTKYIGCDDRKAAEKIAQHLNKAGIKTKILDRPEKTEFMKIFETTYYGLLIGWAQDVYRICKEKGLDYNETVEWYKEIEQRGLPRPIFRPGLIGGHCVMPNIKILKKVTKSKYLDAIEESNKWIEKNGGIEDDKKC